MTTTRPYQLVEGVFELLQTVDKLVLGWRFGAQSQDALWWTEMETQPSLCQQRPLRAGSDDRRTGSSDAAAKPLSPPGLFFLLFLVFFLRESSPNASAAFCSLVTKNSMSSRMWFRICCQNKSQRNCGFASVHQIGRRYVASLRSHHSPRLGPLGRPSSLLARPPPPTLAASHLQAAKSPINNRSVNTN